MIKVVNIIGSGNVANFFVAKLDGRVKIENIYSREFDHATRLGSKVNSKPVDEIEILSRNADLNIICVSDDAIPEIVLKLDKNIPVVHTSGSVGITVLKDFREYGVLYPLQSITKSRISKLQKIPFLIETSSLVFSDSLMDFCNKYLSDNTIYADSEKRAQIHLAAVFSNNFTNFFLLKAKKILEEAGVDFEILLPLMTETISKAFEIGPEKSQTGPAFRKDTQLIEQHLTRIKDTELREIYKLISSLISKETIV